MQHGLGAYADVTSVYAGMLGRDYEGLPWAGYGESLYQRPGGLNIQQLPITAQLQAAKKAEVAAVAVSDIKGLPGGGAGVPRPLIIDGSTLFGNAGIVAAVLAANVDVLVNTYTVQVGYRVVIDNEDPLQLAALRPYDNTTAGAYIDCTCKVDVAEAATGDGNTILTESTIVWRPDQQWSAGDRFRARWNKKWTGEPGDLIRTWLRLPNGSPAQTVAPWLSRIHHVVRCWKILG